MRGILCEKSAQCYNNFELTALTTLCLNHRVLTIYLWDMQYAVTPSGICIYFYSYALFAALVISILFIFISIYVYYWALRTRKVRIVGNWAKLSEIACSSQFFHNCCTLWCNHVRNWFNCISHGCGNLGAAAVKIHMSLKYSTNVFIYNGTSA